MSCNSPVRIRNNSRKHNTQYLFNDVPCGRCYDCRKAHAAKWQARLSNHNKGGTPPLFVTLTYNDDNLIYAGELPTLHKPDFQNFVKRIRKLTRAQVSYYAVGEYGGKFQRPHYHAIMWNVTVDMVARAWSLDGKMLGRIEAQQCADGAIRYVTNYTVKTRLSDDQLLGRLPEFSLMSKGLGNDYLTPEMHQWHKQNKANYTILPGGIKSTLPRYYKDRIFSDWDKYRNFYEWQDQINDITERNHRRLGGELKYQHSIASLNSIKKDLMLTNRLKRDLHGNH